MKKKLLAIILCAVLLTGVCATSFAAKDIGSVMRLVKTQENLEGASDEYERKCYLVKLTIERGIEEFINHQLSKRNFDHIQNTDAYKKLMDSYDNFKKFYCDLNQYSVLLEYEALSISSLFDKVAAEVENFVKSSYGTLSREWINDLNMSSGLRVMSRNIPTAIETMRQIRQSK